MFLCDKITLNAKRIAKLKYGFRYSAIYYRWHGFVCLQNLVFHRNQFNLCKLDFIAYIMKRFFFFLVQIYLLVLLHNN